MGFIEYNLFYVFTVASRPDLCPDPFFIAVGLSDPVRSDFLHDLLAFARDMFSSACTSLSRDFSVEELHSAVLSLLSGDIYGVFDSFFMDSDLLSS